MRYTYDQAGNRLSKEDVLNQLSTEYWYDVQDPSYYGSQGNRLVKSWTIDDAEEELVQERFYFYDKGGRVKYVVVKDEPLEPGPDGPIYTGTQIIYNEQGLVAVAWQTRWHLTTEGSEVDENTVEYISAMQYRYDGGRSRYLVQRSDPRLKFPSGDFDNHFRKPWTPGGAPEWTGSEGKWADYDGGEIRGDFGVTVSGPPQDLIATLSETMTHEAGLAQAPWNGALPPSAVDTAYLQGNLIGSTERMTDANAAVVRRVVYTAFGEPVFEDGTVGTRYGYAGGWGYQGTSYPLTGDPPMTGDPLADLGWLHVGARYYDPSAGRFMQRDPIGMAGGPNTYLYLGNLPTQGVDPEGEFPWLVAGGATVVAAAILMYSWSGGAPTGCAFLDWTGGQTSWLDDPNTVRNVSLGLSISGIVVGTGGVALGFVAEGFLGVGFTHGSFTWGVTGAGLTGWFTVGPGGQVINWAAPRVSLQIPVLNLNHLSRWRAGASLCISIGCS